MQAFKVITPGPYTTVQDLGRFGYQRFGVPVSGVMDRFAVKVANLLVGNNTEAAVLEMTFMGPRLEWVAPATFAMTGAPMNMTLNGESVSGWRSVQAAPGDILEFKQVSSGCRAYLAVNGGVDVPEVMGSRSTYVGGAFGGLKGRPLKAVDMISCGEVFAKTALQQLPPKWIPAYSSEKMLRAIPGPQDHFFSEGLEVLFGSEYTVSPKADRMGYRLEGPAVKIREDMPSSIISEPSVPGGIQVPADGQPIVLFVEQTVGGYAKIATVISSDLLHLAQAIPGDTVRFKRVDLESAHRIHRAQADQFDQIIRLLSP